MGLGPLQRGCAFVLALDLIGGVGGGGGGGGDGGGDGGRLDFLGLYLRSLILMVDRCLERVEGIVLSGVV